MHAITPGPQTIDLAKAMRLLRKDERLAPDLKRLPRPLFERKTSHGKPADPFYALTESIVYQQLSGKAAGTIYGRFLTVFPKKKPTPKALLKLSDEAIRATGISSQKLSYLKDLAQRFEDRTIDEKGLETWSDDEVRAHLTAVKGIGRWTADMFLIFYLNRSDILPTGDLGIQKGFKKLFNMKKMPTPERMEKLARAWSPHRTVASRYLWMIQDEPKII
jgi:DNA-3-methyladenine glycosylase II